MRLLGRASWSREDYQLAFALKHEYIKLPKGSLFDPNSYNTEVDNNAAVRRGLFNVRRWVGELRSGDRLRADNDPFPELPNGQAPVVGTGNIYGPSPDNAKFISGGALNAGLPRGFNWGPKYDAGIGSN